MKTVLLCVGFYSLGIFNCAVFAAVYLLHRPRYVAPTMKRKRDALPEVTHYPPMPQVKPARELEDQQPMYMYGVTGLEE